jgi:hypothetical protein
MGLWSISATLLALELATALWFGMKTGGSARIEAEGYHRGRYFKSDPLLGYGAQPQTSVKVRKVFGKHTVYDVRYHIDEHGLRESGRHAVISPRHGQNILFFGCSFTFGEGVSDEESLPYQIALKSHGLYTTYNFGFHGYGPHQMLAILQSGRDQKIVDRGRPTTHAVHIALLPSHIDRMMGRNDWDLTGPRYIRSERDPEGVRWAGPFRSQIRTWIERLSKPSQIYHRVISPLLYPYSSGPRPASELTTYAALLKASQRLFERRYGGQFVVIIWPDPQASPAPFAQLLRSHQIPHITIDDLIPALTKDRSPYFLNGDGHPSAKAYREIADALLKHWRREAPMTAQVAPSQI